MAQYERLNKMRYPRGKPHQLGEPVQNDRLPGWSGQGVKDTNPVMYDEGSDMDYIPEPYSYSLIFDITGGATFNQTQNIQIQADAEFILLQTQYNFFLKDTPSPSVLDRLLPLGANVQLTDSGSGRNLLNEAVPVPSIFGDGILPFILTTPKAFAAATVLRTTISTGSVSLNAADTTLVLVFTGEKRYYLNT